MRGGMCAALGAGMTTRLLLIAALFTVCSCAHAELTGEEHRAAAANDLRRAEREKARYDPDVTAVQVQPRSPFIEDPTVPRFYNPTAAHLAQADRRMESAYKHLEAARKLEKYEDAACSGVSQAERMSCPLIAPHLQQVEEGKHGVVLHLKSAERAGPLAAQLKCHLAFAQANDFDRTPCPLFIKGVEIDLQGTQAISVTSKDDDVAAQVRMEARKMFGEMPNTVSAR